MALDRATKENTVNEIQTSFSDAKSLVVVHYKGLTVSDITDLRNQAREQGVFVKVTKNSLTKIALENTPYKDLKDLFSGQTAVAYSAQDEVSPAKAVVGFSKKNENLVIVGGALGEEILDEAGVKNVASMPSLDESRAKIVGILTTPAAQLARLLQTPAGNVARVIAVKPEGTEGASAAPAEEAKEEPKAEAEEAKAEATPAEEPKAEEAPAAEEAKGEAEGEEKKD